MSPTQRTLAHLRKLGYTAQVVERWNQFAKVRQDLLGFIDVLAIGDGRIVGVQATASAVAARVEKIRNEPRAREWLRAGGLIEVHGWAKKGAAGKRKTYQLRTVRIWLDGEAMITSEDDA
jgi:carbonic anhydrase